MSSLDSEPEGWRNKQNILKFIKLYQSLPTLWLRTSKDYGNKLKREVAYAKMVHLCQKFHPTADKSFVVNKINNLRTSFNKEHSKVRRSRASLGDDQGGQLHEPHLWYYHFLHFIVDQQAPDTSDQRLDQDFATADDSMDQPALTSSEAISETSFDLDSFQIYKVEEDADQTPLKSSLSSPFAERYRESSPLNKDVYKEAHSPDAVKGLSRSPKVKPHAPVAVRAMKRRYNADQDVGLHPPVSRTVGSTGHPPPVHDENDLFGNTIALCLKNTSRQQNIYARKLMFEVMAEAELGNLSGASYFIANPELSTTSTKSSSVLTNGQGEG